MKLLKVIIFVLLTSCATNEYLLAYKFEHGKSEKELKELFPEYFNWFFGEPSEIKNIILIYDEDKKLYGKMIPYLPRYEEVPVARFLELIKGDVYFADDINEKEINQISSIVSNEVNDTEAKLIMSEYESKIPELLGTIGYVYNDDGLALDIKFLIKDIELYEGEISLEGEKIDSEVTASAKMRSENVGKKIYQMTITASKIVNNKRKMVYGALLEATNKGLSRKNIFRKLLYSSMKAIRSRESKIENRYMYFYNSRVDPIFAGPITLPSP